MAVLSSMIRLILTLCLTCIPLFAAPKAPAYDPLSVPEASISSLTLEACDASRNRTLPLRVYLPPSQKPAAVILFSHGLGGSCDNNPYLGNHWAKRGFLVVFVQHPGSDESIWKSQPPAARLAAMQQAASLDNLIARTQDIPFVLQSLTAWNQQSQHPLFHRLNLKAIGMSGHSFGALTTQALAGQAIPGKPSSLADPRISAALMMSPSSPAHANPAQAFSPIHIPCLLMTGTNDASPIGNQTPQSRLKVFPFLQQAPAWQVVFDGATHMDFGQRSLTGSPITHSRYHQAILALSTAFWDATLNHNPTATSWLKSTAPTTILSPKDTWQYNQK